MLDALETVLRPLFALTSLFYLALAIRVTRSSPQYANSAIGYMLGLVGVLVAGTVFSYATTDPNFYGIGRTLSYFASGFMPVAFYFVYREYTVGPPSVLVVAVLCLVPIATTLLAITNPMHHIIWSMVETGSGTRFTDLTDHYWFNRVHAPFMYGLFLYSVVALAGRLPTMAPAHRKTILLLIVFAMVPFMVSVTNTVLGFGPADFPFSTLSFMVLMPAYWYLSMTLRFYEFSPLAYQTLFNHVSDPIIVLDSTEAIVCVNERGQEFLGRTEQELLGRKLWEDFPKARELLRKAGSLELTQTLRMDDSRVYELSVRPLTGPKGQDLGMVVICRDVTQRRQALDQLADNEHLIRTLIENSSNGILRFSQDIGDAGGRFRCVFANKAAESFIGNASGALVGRPLLELSQLDPQQLAEHFSSAKGKPRPVSYELSTVINDGEGWMRVVAEPIGEDFSVTLVDITDRKRDEDKMLADALLDPLTGTLNRRGFEQEAGKALRASECGAVLYLDLDQFKGVNDKFGHPAGDALLKAFGHRLGYCLRPEDVLGRLGGDEFAIVLPDVSVDDAKHVAERLVKTASEAYIIKGQEINCTASVGIALMPKHGEDLWHLMSVADAAMYKVKNISSQEAANDRSAYIDAAIAT
ncbi:MAG: diguanylate cyclase [Pseudomonadota bacterium]